MSTAVQPVATEVRYVQGVQIRTAAADGPYLECTATTYGDEKDVGPFYETMDKGVFASTLAQHRDSVKLIVGHDDTVPGVGTPVEWEDDEHELRAVYRFLSHTEARQAASIAADGGFGGVSVGFLPGRKPHHNTWTRDADGHIHVTRHEARLLHLGLVTTPANADSRFQMRSMGIPDELDLRTPRLDDARKILERLQSSRVSL